MTADQAGRMRAVARWHRRIAIGVMAWLAALAFTGILVNHANDWGLDRRPLAKPLQSWIYGIETATADFCAGTVLTGPDCDTIFARIELPGSSLLVGPHGLFLLDGEGQLLEKLVTGQAGLARIAATYLEADKLYLGDGDKIVRTGPDLLEFRTLSDQEAAALDNVVWLLPPQGKVHISWERLILDVHAARFLGPLAKVFNDLVAGLILLLALSGFWLHRLKRKVNGNGR